MPTIVKTTKSQEKRRVSKSISLKEMLEVKEDVPVTEQLPCVPYSETQLVEAWMSFAYQIKSSDLDFFSTLSAFLPKIKEDQSVVVEVHNVTQRGDIQKMKPELLQTIRKTLDNYTVDFEILVNAAEAKFIAVTPQEKFKKLAEKNKHLEELRKKLDLGF